MTRVSVFIFCTLFLVFSTYFLTIENSPVDESLGWLSLSEQNGLASLTPYWTSLNTNFDGTDKESGMNYWLRYVAAKKYAFDGNMKTEFYVPFIPQVVILIEIFLFGGNFFFYHILSLLLFVCLLFVLYRLLLVLGVENKIAMPLLFFASIHPYFSGSLMFINGQQYILCVLFGLISWYLYLIAKTRRSYLLSLLFFFFALLSNISAIAFLPVMILSDFVVNERQQPFRYFSKKFGFVFFVPFFLFLFYRILFPLASLPTSLEANYHGEYKLMLFEKYSMNFFELFQWVAVIPPFSPTVFEPVAMLSGLLAPMFVVVALFLAFKQKSRLSQYGLLFLFISFFFSVLQTARLESGVLTGIGFVIITADVLAAILAKSKAYKIVLVLYSVFFLASCLYQHLFAQAFLGFYARTADNMAEQLAESIKDVSHNSKVYLINTWGGSAMLPAITKMKLDRSDIDVQILATNPIAYPDDMKYSGIPMLKALGIPSSLIKSEILLDYRILGNAIEITAKTGALFISPADFSHKAKNLAVFTQKRLFFKDFVVHRTSVVENSVKSIVFSFKKPIKNADLVLMFFADGKWNRIDNTGF